MLTSYILFFLGATVQPTYANTDPATVTKTGDIIINVTNKPIREVLTLIEKQSKFIFVYNSESVKLNKTVTLNITSTSINEVMSLLLKGTSLTYEVSDRQILIIPTTEKQNTNRTTVSGVVSDENGEPLIGVNVQIKGESSGTITDTEGKYSMTVPAGKSLLFSYIG